MRIVTITAGTGSFHCGSCMRDNALTLALRRRGHDALMVPLYLPPILDEESAAPNQNLFYGGINVYLQQTSNLFHKTPRWLDKWLDSPKLLAQVAQRAGMTRAEKLGSLTLSTLRGEEGRQLKELSRLTDWLESEAKADVICLSNALLIGMAPFIKKRTGAKVLCTLQGEDYFLDSLSEADSRACWDTLSAKAQSVDALIAVSRYYGDLMQRRAHLDPNRLHVLYNGIALDGYPQTLPDSLPNPPVVGYFARMNPLKGLGELISAYILLRQRNRIPKVRLRVGGSQTAGDALYVALLEKQLREAGLEGEFEFLPNLSRTEKITFLQSLSVLSVPATYGESFGLYLLEAWAAGVPVVQPRHAAFPELIEETRGGLLCEPNSPDSLAETLESLLLDPKQQRELGANGHNAVFSRFNVDRMAEEFLAICEQA
jgi:glycosyltransferase involved in cell wall biosynthesis